MSDVRSVAAVRSSVGKHGHADGRTLMRLDNAYRWNGSFDEVRFYRRALTATELDAIRLRNAPVPAGEVLRLPFDRVRG